MSPTSLRTTERFGPGSRRVQTIDAAADIIRTAGPAAVTSVAVAGRLGITQSAVYRHVRDVDELRTAAIHRVVERLDQDLASVASASVLASASAEELARFLRRLTNAITEHTEAFELVDRWRFEEGDLGRGIRSTLARGRDGIVAIIAGLWMAESPEAAPLTRSQRAVLVAHAQLIQDDILGVARLLRQPGWPGSVRAAGDLLAARCLGAWAAVHASLDG